MMVKKKSHVAPAIILFSIALSGCSNSGTSEVAKTANTNQTTTVSNSAVNQTPTAANTVAAAASPNAAAPVAGSNPQPTVGSVSPATADKGRKPSTNDPAPQIGSGASDFLLFTQVRGALDADQDLMKGVIVEMKEGNVVLTGSVSSEAQKTKAAQLVQGVEGIKSVKNNLRVAS